MHSTIDHLVGLFKGVRDVRACMKQYCLHHNEFTPSIWDIELGFEHTYGKKIQRVKVPGGALRLVRGIYMPFVDHVVILLDGEMSEHWERYISTKELCHLILKNKEYITSDPASLIETMIYEEKNPVDGEAPLDLVLDSWSRYAAHELLFPFSERARAKEKLETTPPTETTFSLAQQYEVPEHVIEWTLSPTYQATCTAAWNQISQ